MSEARNSRSQRTDTHVPPVAPMRWWGWGRDSEASPLPEAARKLLRERFGLDGSRVDAPVALGDIELPDCRLDERVRNRLADAVGAAHVHSDRIARVSHAAGRSYPDLVRLRAGDLATAPDAVVMPGSAVEVERVLAIARSEGVAVVPFGGGTSVVGGVEPLPGQHGAVVTLDLRRLSGVLAVDPAAHVATVGAGTTGPDLERALRAHGVTLGHFPQSFEFSTVGGWVAARSSGQASSGYGRIDDVLVGTDLVAPAGRLVLPALPATAAGPDLRRLVLGSEGALGVVTECSLRVRPLPAARHYEAWSLPSFADGCEALRALAQERILPDVARLSDEEETAISLALAGDHPGVALVRRYLRLRGHRQPCLLVTIYEGDGHDVAWRRARCRRVLRGYGGVALGSRPARQWERERFRGPYLRDALLDHGVLVETLETATLWSNLARLYGAVRGALRSALTRVTLDPVVMCHVSHLYETGASLYFTFLAPAEAEERIALWAAAKRAACEAIVANGGTISHHHGVGRDHREWLETEDSALGLAALRALKRELDPDGIMNPGKLLP
ncbi:MAG: FAD-binding oxidoreductase [Thermoleophilum sp.]|nr:FAD-binding oxidoreductase [Thermoleophilum sp.]